MIDKNIFRRYSLVFVLGAFYLGLGVLLRVVLWARFGTHADVPAVDLLLLLGAGVVNDAVECLYLLAPLSLYVLLVPDRWYRSAFSRALLASGTVLTLGGFLYVAVAETYFFEEFDARFNLVAFDYLAYPNEVFTDIWEAYPVGLALLATVALALAATWLLRRRIAVAYVAGTSLLGRARVFACLAVALLAAILYYPTNALSLSGNRVENEIAQNGYSSFFRAARTSEIDYHAYYEAHDPTRNLRLLERQLGAGGGRFTKLDRGRLDRKFDAKPGGLGRLNVVVVASESFGAEFSRLHGSSRDLTPQFDSFARRGIWFANAYASGTRTVRGLEAISASFPPIPTVSILRRPGNQGIATWGRVMQDLGYHTSFLYGGYGTFDEMNGFFAGNGFEVLDRSDIDQVRFANVWGVSDEDLFDRALQHFGEQHARHRPFFSIIMTTSNHKPFTFRKGLESLGIPESGGGRKAGVRYADYALGSFLRQAARQPWFDDTVFVVVADHGARVYGKVEIPLRTYEIPLMIYSPKHLAPRQVDTLTTQIDIAPTVLGLLGLPYEAPFFGEDVLSHPDAPRVALFSHNHDVAIYRDGEMVVLGLGGTASAYTYDRAFDTYAPAARDTALEDLGVAYFQTASELFQAHRYE